MLQFVTVCIIVFLLLLGFVAFSTYLSGLKKSPPLAPETNTINRYLLDDHERRIATESRQDAERTMDNYQDQMRRFYEQQGVPRSMRF